MTNDKMDLHALVGKSADGDFLRDMIGFAAQRLMELEVGVNGHPVLRAKATPSVTRCRFMSAR